MWFQMILVGFIPVKMQGSGNQANYFLGAQYSELSNAVREKKYLQFSGFCDGENNSKSKKR